MSDWFRVRDDETKAEYNSPFLSDGLTHLKNEPTHDVYGNPIPVKYPEAAAPKAASKETAK